MTKRRHRDLCDLKRKCDRRRVSLRGKRGVKYGGSQRLLCRACSIQPDKENY